MTNSTVMVILMYLWVVYGFLRPSYGRPMAFLWGSYGALGSEKNFEFEFAREVVLGGPKKDSPRKRHSVIPYVVRK